MNMVRNTYFVHKRIMRNGATHCRVVKKETVSGLVIYHTVKGYEGNMSEAAAKTAAEDLEGKMLSHEEYL